MKTRNTAQLGIVRDALCRLGNHPTAEQVYELVNADHPTISKATVYRTLNKLADQGIARKVFAPQGADHFDHNPTEHAHVQCKVCGCVDDVMLDFGPALTAQAAQLSGYEIHGMHVQFLGVCPQCKARCD